MTDAMELVIDARVALGESPVWDARTGHLYWVDLLGGTLHITRPEAGADTAIHIGGTIGAIALTEGSEVIAAVDDGFAVVSPETGHVSLLASVESDNDANRMNDGKVDPAGRFWAGTMARDERAGAGSLYRLNLDRSVDHVLSGLTISNGIDWSLDGRSMYHIDTATRGVDQFDFDEPSGALSNRRRLITIAPGDGYPDGMTVDGEGYLWVALFDGWAVHRYAADGTLDRRVELPAAQVTSITFGGPELDELYITTGHEGFPPEGKPDQPHAGSLFRYRANVRGRPPNRCQVRLPLAHDLGEHLGGPKGSY